MKKLFVDTISDVRSWSEFKHKLSSYNTSNEKDGCKCTTAGILFEYFAKFYFLIEASVKDDFKAVWLYDEIPLDVKSLLNIGNIEHGVDLLLMDIEGNYIPVQCKFKNDETQKLSWSKDKISNLFAFIPNASRYIVFSNASDIDDVSKTRYKAFNFFSIQKFSNIQLSLISAQLKTEIIKFTPQPFQIDAINSSINHYKNNNRGQLILPCGAGKTLTALWIKEALASIRTIVLVPSLALLRQIKNQWATQRNFSFRYLCVCSETSIDSASDDIVLHTYDLDSAVTTEPSVVRDFVSNSSPFVIYSTYQSLKVISDAVKNLDFTFDLVICDEAHRTAGADKSLFGLVHDKTLIPAVYRLYMTATPRVFSNTIKRNLEAENTFLFDMSDSNIFGTEFYRMSFKQAIELGILVDYKIISIGISSNEVKKYIENRYFIEKDNTADTIANIVALEKVMHKYNASHAITFHSRIKYAHHFSTTGSKLWNDISTNYVSGEMTTGVRSLLLDNFKNQPIAVLSNARCLTEGVDLPAIDLVYFCDPKNSKIDIVQASGRALRKDKSKPAKIGLIVVPIYHTENDDLEEAVDKSCFKNLIQVIRSMSDQDERLQEEINYLAFSKGKRTSDSLHFEYIDADINKQAILVFNNFAEQLKKYIFTQVLENTCINWDLHFLELKEWLSKHTDYPVKKNNQSLFVWVSNQRTLKREGRLNPERVNRLDELGFIWDFQDDSWNRYFEQLNIWLDKHKDYPVKKTNKTLFAWVASQRNFKREGKLSTDRIQKLDEIGFIWDYQEFTWNNYVKELIQWRSENNNRWPSQRKPKNEFEKTLAIWLLKVNSDYKANLLDENRLNKLMQAGYIFDDRKWREKYDKLCELLKNGNGFPTNPQNKLYRFCMAQFKKYNEKSLSELQIQLLDQIDFIANFTECIPGSLEDAINALCEYVAEHGKMPSQQYPLCKNGTYKFISLSNCIRSAYSDNRLSKQSIDNLNKIGFVFNSEIKRNEEWNSTFNELREFRINNPERWPNQTILDEKQLCAWCLHQKQWYNGKKKKYGPYPQERKDKLDSIGFNWKLGNKWGHDEDSVSWELSFAQYQDYCRNNPNSVLPSSINGVRNNLSTWYHNQRSLFRKNKLPIDKVNMLREAGILDNLDKVNDQSNWNARLDEYLTFRQNNATSELPYKVNGKNNPLSAWYHRQRFLFRKNKLSNDKISKLRKAGILENA
jgi:superfamily II DNA or RNA helicase